MDETKLVYPESDAKEVIKFLSANGYRVDYLLGREATRHARCEFRPYLRFGVSCETG